MCIWTFIPPCCSLYAGDGEDSILPFQADRLLSWRTDDACSTSESSVYDGIIGFLRRIARPVQFWSHPMAFALRHAPILERIRSGYACCKSKKAHTVMLRDITYRFDGSGSCIWNSTPNDQDRTRLPSMRTQAVLVAGTEQQTRSLDEDFASDCSAPLFGHTHEDHHAVLLGLSCLTDILFLTVLCPSAVMVGISCHEAATLKIVMVHSTLFQL